MKLVLPLVLVAIVLANGCCATCASCKSKSNGSYAQKPPMTKSEKIVAAKPTVKVDPAVKPVEHRTLTPPAKGLESAVPRPAVQPVMPEGEPSAMVVPPRPAELAEPKAALPTPRQIARRPMAPTSDEDWMESPESQDANWSPARGSAN
jgi:hypothetical protein